MATRQSARTLATLPREMLIEIGKNLANLADFFAFYTTFRFLRIFEKNDVVLISEWLMKNRRFPIILAIRAFGKEAAPYVQYMLARNKRLAPLPDTPRRSKRAERGRGLPRQGKWVTPCILAASKGYWEVLQVLIAAGADVNIDDGSGFTPLMAAAAHGSPRAVSMLCCAGAHLDAVCVPDPDAPHVRRTALGIACARGRVMAARLLLARGASINVEGTQSLVHMAAEFKTCTQGLLAALVKHGAEMDARDERGYTPLMVAVDKDYAAGVTALLAAGANATLLVPNTDCSIMTFAVKQMSHAAITALSNAGVDVNARDAAGETPLSRAIRSRDMETATFLVSNVASVDVNAANAAGYTPLMLMALISRVASHDDLPIQPEVHFQQQSADCDERALVMAQRLLDAGADVTATTPSGHNALSLAAREHAAPLVRELLAYVPDYVNAPAGHDKTPLEHALMHDPPVQHAVLLRRLHETVAALVGAGARLGIDAAVGRAAFQAAAHYGLMDVVHHVAATALDTKAACSCYAAALNGALISALGSTAPGHNAIVALLVRLLADPNKPDDRGRHVAVALAGAGRFDILYGLMCDPFKPLDTFVTDSDGTSPLVAAAKGGDATVVRKLIGLGHCVNGDPLYTGRTPLQLAVEGGHDAVVRLLLEHGANPNLTGTDDDARIPPLIAAVRKESPDVLGALLEARAATSARCDAALRGYVPASDLRWHDDLDLNMDAVDARGRTALMRAAMEGRMVMAQMLVEAGADKDATDDDGRTALHLASREGMVEVVRYLLRVQADWRKRDADGATAYDMSGSGAVKNLLREQVKAGWCGSVIDGW